VLEASYRYLLPISRTDVGIAHSYATSRHRSGSEVILHYPRGLNLTSADGKLLTCATSQMAFLHKRPGLRAHHPRQAHIHIPTSSARILTQ
jgi:hypothetical protein